MLRADCDAVEASAGAGGWHLPAVPVLGLGRGHLTHLGARVGAAQLPLCSREVWEIHLVLRQVCGVGGRNCLLHPAVAVKADRDNQLARGHLCHSVPPGSLTAAASSASSRGRGVCPPPRWHVPRALPRPVCSGPFRSPPPAQTKAGPAPKEGARKPVPRLYPSRTRSGLAHVEERLKKCWVEAPGWVGDASQAPEEKQDPSLCDAVGGKGGKPRVFQASP